MDSLVKQIINSCWSIFIAVWLLAAIFTKRTVYRENLAQRLAYTCPIMIGCCLLFRRSRRADLFKLRIIPDGYALLVAAAILCICGLGFCFGPGPSSDATGAAPLP